jgi:membrane protein required for colicin V production
VSALVSVLRGLVREVLSLVTWVLAFWIAITFFPAVAVLFEGRVELPSARLFLAFLVLFVGTLMAGGLAGFLIGKLVESTGLTGTDRLLGVVFGAARGVVVVAILVLLAGLTPFPNDPWWRQSTLIPHVLPVAIWFKGFLPAEIAGHFRFDDAPPPESPPPPAPQKG